MINRIDKKFMDLKQRGRKALITYITAGDPELCDTPKLVQAMEEGGADIIELGIPYSDPVAEGPVIQEASVRALANKIKIEDVFNCIKEIRLNTEIPLILLVYYNCIFKYGMDKFLNKCAENGIDGLIIPDLPYEEKDSIAESLGGRNIEVITMVAPTSNNRIENVSKNAKGFICCVSSLGVTGIREDFHSSLAEFVGEIGKHTDTPRAIGFGISTPEQVRKLKDLSEGLIVGSAIVKKIGEAASPETAVADVRSYVAELRIAMDK